MPKVATPLKGLFKNMVGDYLRVVAKEGGQAAGREGGQAAGREASQAAVKAADAPLPKAKRSRSTETGLAPNQHYSGGKTGKGKPRYEYVTDDKGRIRGAYGDLKLKPEGQKRGSHNSKPAGKVTGDDAGHLFADRFDGAGGLDNIVAQARELNQGAWKNMEQDWADALNAGKKVEVFTEVHYGGGSRPTGFTVTYEIDGRRVIQTFDQ